MTKELNKMTIKELRQVMTDNDIGYMSNWTKPVLIKRLEEHEVLISKLHRLENNHNDAISGLEDRLEFALQKQKEYLEDFDELTKARNIIAKQKAENLELIKKLKGAIELTKTTF